MQEFENLNNDNIHTVKPKIHNTPRLQNKWTIKTIDDEPYLIYTENENLFKFDPVTCSAWSGREKNDEIPLPSKALQKALQKKHDESRKLNLDTNRTKWDNYKTGKKKKNDIKENILKRKQINKIKIKKEEKIKSLHNVLREKKKKFCNCSM